MNSEHLDTFLNSSINQEYNLKENLQCRLNSKMNSRFRQSRPQSTVVCRQGPCVNRQVIDRSKSRNAQNLDNHVIKLTPQPDYAPTEPTVNAPVGNTAASRPVTAYTMSLHKTDEISEVFRDSKMSFALP